jgi:hypothetical protein
MRRAEFDKPTKRAALKRSGGQCEAGTVAPAEWYGLDAGTRCYALLSYGVEFDHIDLDANSRDNSLGNCAAVCKRCHSFKTRNRDIPLAAKTVRQRDKHAGIKTGSTRALPGTRASGIRKRMNGTVERW